MKVLITGSSGLLGRMLIGHLLTTDAEIVGIDIRESPEFMNRERFRFYNCSITDKEKLKSVFQEEQPTNVMHFACSFNKVRNKTREYEIDIDGSDNILEICNDTPSVRQLIFSSSSAVYGGKKDNPLWMKESDPLLPDNYRYGMNKKIVEDRFTNISVRNDLKVVILRLCLITGPIFDKPKSVISILIKMPFLPRFTKEMKLQFIHCEDMSALMELIMKDTDISGVYNLVPDSYALVGEIVPEKRFISLPFFLIKGFMWICWHLKITNIQPASVINSFYPTIVDSSKIISRYGYKFKYNSKEAFLDTKMNNRLPADVWF
ncbi:MAG TPA: NAD(P)-dependent oxidoreductase [Bacteroidales bacterium]|jgi:UDP-glucose 4-epimerase|nr:NAD(P)-dependent oxidoreductase [Bacteroidales bacterium]HOX76333.1 NAD(P)-dependent oxidoreductase [Bacteroidales bacterium]HQM70180.1 NAD(P)-dependent oxidoreductase [Bacteroidales bacterium]